MIGLQPRNVTDYDPFTIIGMDPFLRSQEHDGAKRRADRGRILIGGHGIRRDDPRGRILRNFRQMPFEHLRLSPVGSHEREERQRQDHPDGVRLMNHDCTLMTGETDRRRNDLIGRIGCIVATAAGNAGAGGLAVGLDIGACRFFVAIA